MISHPFMLLSILIGSILAFFTAAFAIEIVLKVFRIEHPRVRSVLRLLPFLSLILDLSLNQYSIAQWLNPLSCSSCIQKFFLGIFFPELQSHLSLNQISLIKHLGNGSNHSIFSVMFIAFELLSLFFVLYKLGQAFLVWHRLNIVLRRASIYKRPIDSPLLAETLRNYKMNIYLSNQIQIPLAAYPNNIIIPSKTVGVLSQQELEAVIAHEWEHLRYQDPLTRLLYHVIAAFFWWVPTKAWMKKIEHEQELACDQNVLKYGVRVDSIASALLNVAKHVKLQQTVCYFASSDNATVARVRTILGLGKKNKASLFGLNFFGVIIGAAFLVICVMWL